MKDAGTHERPNGLTDAIRSAKALPDNGLVVHILVVSDLPQFVTGGAEIQAARLIEEWLNSGHQVICLGRRMKSGPLAVGGHLVTVRRIRMLSIFGRWGRAASYACSLTWLLLHNRRWADVVYTRFMGEAAVVAALLKRFGLVKATLVATPANIGGEGDLAFLRSVPFHSSLIRLLERHCDAINLIADGLVDELTQAGFSGRNFSRIPNGIRTTEPNRVRQISPPVFLAVGRLAPQKGYDILLSALARMRHSLGRGQIRIAGDGPEMKKLVRMAQRLNVDVHVTWLGELNQIQVRQELDNANVFLLPSRYEGLSNAGLEAMERGLPIILTRCGGLDKYVGDECGWVVPPEDTDALTDALSQALVAGPVALAEMGARARSLVKSEFDITAVARRYVELFERLQRTSQPSER